ncbi:MAG: Na+/H+ antiporter subunit E [Chloroflexi bacterium]|nr:Na+/H+ antiporter subunit E [Chloroflexota bacterium]MCI0575947.1 Na+/H+ antiporter subunit E [Chloroflexota bacterium]MCI0643728.1 Na+/H+ antiporter subunit E [Chloroflexota bacterium]MCI0725895.1 Na+/H+ antiporter subunit E [Chloroflexota bacterium]
MSNQTAAKLLKSLPPQVQEATIICPLCGTVAPASGLRARPGDSAGGAPWQLLFTCPACGLLTAFNASQLSLKQIESFHGSAWATELRQFQQDIRRGQLRYRRRATRRHFVGVFLVSFLTWMVLIGNLHPAEIVWGLAISLIISRFTYRFLLFNFWGWMYDPYRWLQLGKLLLEFGRQIIVQNVTLALRVFRPDLPIRPGIVAVPTKLRNDVQLTLLGSLMTLTPDTVTMDIDQQRGLIYVHWIDVKTTDPQEARRLISASLEDKIIGWLD